MVVSYEFKILRGKTRGKKIEKCSSEFSSEKLVLKTKTLWWLFRKRAIVIKLRRLGIPNRIIADSDFNDHEIESQNLSDSSDKDIQFQFNNDVNF